MRSNAVWQSQATPCLQALIPLLIHWDVGVALVVVAGARLQKSKLIKTSVVLGLAVTVLPRKEYTWA